MNSPETPTPPLDSRRVGADLSDPRVFVPGPSAALGTRQHDELTEDLSGATLPQASFEEACLQGWCFTGAELANANFMAADLRSADLSAANLRAAELTRADLRGANLVSANLEGANLRFCSLDGAQLQGCNLRWSQICGASLVGANLHGADLRGAVADDTTRWPEGFDHRAAGVWLREADVLEP